MKCDISKYFENIDHEILLELLRKQLSQLSEVRLPEVELRKLLDLCEKITRSVPSGVPIGNLTSQSFANTYLNELDQYVKRELKERQYIRYMDDFVILGTDIRRLHEDRELIRSFLCKKLKLQLHPKKSIIFPVSPHGIDFLGYRVYAHHVELRASTIRRRKQKFRKLLRVYRRGDIHEVELREFIRAWDGYAKHARSWSTICGMLQEAESSRSSTS